MKRIWLLSFLLLITSNCNKREEEEEEPTHEKTKKYPLLLNFVAVTQKFF